VMERFGYDVGIAVVDDEHFLARMCVSPMGVQFWALQFLPHCEVVKPKWLRDEIIEKIVNNPYLKRGERT